MASLTRVVVIGKAEGRGIEWHGHITAVSISCAFRRTHLASTLISLLENVSEDVYNGYFVDLFVREGNNIAMGMYEKLGYRGYRRVIGYYGSDGENAWDMRKALRRDKEKASMVPLGRDAYPEECYF